MAISSAMYAAVTGLSALGTGMQTISNNIANVNTVGFKAGRTNYEDLISQNYYSSNHVNQRGCGAKVSSIQSLFSQGAFKHTNQDTDLAIAGEGFFNVRSPITNELFYTRAGNFTLTKQGQLEDPSGNILQGWQMSIPKPGADPVRIGAPTDVKITVLNAPPVASSQLRVIANLNADDKNAFHYPEYAMAKQYADSQASGPAEKARQDAIAATYDPTKFFSLPSTPTPGNPVGVNVPAGTSGVYLKAAVDYYNNTYKPNPAMTLADITNIQVYSNDTVLTPTDRNSFKMTISEFEALKVASDAGAKNAAVSAGKTAYKNMYDTIYKASYDVIVSQLQDWQLEGNGFAAAWDASKTPPIDPKNYTYPQSVKIYDSLGSEHKLNIYYQPNPYMDNVWDYIITCDPLEDARKDQNNSMLFSDAASFSGLIQKGKITFASNKDSARHGGMIKDIEAQNIDLSQSKMATIEAPQYSATTTAVLKNATIGGYYKGSPKINPETGIYESSSRKYTLTWGGNVRNDPPTSGFHWIDDTGMSGTILVSDRNSLGPYSFGSGMTITFDAKDRPLGFGSNDTLTVEANSEQIAWKNLEPNAEGYFDFDVAFVESASMALHPPYPQGLPAVVQNIAMNMGARNPFGMSPEWKLDEESTTQYAAKSNTTFADSDGYAPGSLQRIAIGEDGIVTGIYTNGRHQPLYQIGLTRFLNPWGLSKEGNNLFSETRYSGQGSMNEPAYGGTGTILSNFLEQSNVDLADEIVNMIITQRGFQANSKTVTTTDTMLAEVIEMKR